MILNPFENALLACHNLTLEIEDEIIFQSVSLEVSRHDIAIFYGANGSGKTILLETLAKKRQATGGNVTHHLPDSAIMLPQVPALRRFGNVQQQLNYWARQHNTYLAIPAAMAYLQLDYYQHAPVRYLSMGWRSRLALAKLMLQPSLLWILDDPAGWLDETGHTMLSGLIAGHVRKGGAVIACSRSQAYAKSWLPDDAHIRWFSMMDYMGIMEE
jgi:heme exporter protein A